MENNITTYLLCESTEYCLDWWDHSLNDELLFKTIRRKARKKVFWKCPKCFYSFEKEVQYMVAPYTPECPICKKIKRAKDNMEYELYKTTPVSEIPELLNAWDDDRDPYNSMVITISPTGSYDDTVFRFKCPNGHHPRTSPYSFLKYGCQFCKSNESSADKEHYIRFTYPELAAEWDISKNGKNTPDNTTHRSVKKIAWKCLACGYEWYESPKDRTRSPSSCCPNCEKILNSIGWRYPELANEWSPSNDISPWHVRASHNILLNWICANNKDHIWDARLVSRIKGSMCPYCKETNKSQVEDIFYNEACKLFTNVSSSVQISHPSFTHFWTVDILSQIGSKKIVIEYDGKRWHESKTDIDKRKSLELINAGYWVFRLREIGLVSLDIDSEFYYEIEVNPLSKNISRPMEKVFSIISEA